MGSYDNENNLRSFVDTSVSMSNGDNATRPTKSKERVNDASRVLLPFWTSSAARKQLKYIALDEGKTQQSLLTEALNMLFEKRGRSLVVR
jgi:hypothetical protein